MNEIIEISAIERHGDKAVELKFERYGQMLWIGNDGTNWKGVEVDEELLDMVLNVILEFKEKLTESRRRKAA